MGEMNHPQGASLPNREVEAAWQYHQGTNHSWRSVHAGGHFLDWSNQPRPFKVYPQLSEDRLPTDLPSSSVPALEGMAYPGATGEFIPTCRDLASLLHYAAGITRGTAIPGGQMYFRAAACTGALYHIELYLVCGGVPDLPAGVYHFGAHDSALRRLREGDHRGALVEASGGEPAVAEASAIIVATSVYWRNAWKYQARAYRHAYWDSGTILANLLSVGAARRVPLKLVTAFVDGAVNRLLDLDDEREVALQLVAVGRSPGQQVPPPPEARPLSLEVAPYSQREFDYPAMRQMHAASSLGSPGEVRELWAVPPPKLAGPGPSARLFPLETAPEAELPQDTIESVILRRGSSRRFRRTPIAYSQLSTMLDRACTSIAADFPGGAGATLNQLYLIVNDVDGLPAGSYVFHRGPSALEQLREGDFRDLAGNLDLGQELAADASLNVYFLADLHAALELYGNRGYRMSQLEAAIMGGRLYLGAYAQRLGATGLTFFDDDVTEFFSPHAQGKSVMFLVALGKPVSRRRQAQ